jgi:hypothetical protein
VSTTKPTLLVYGNCQAGALAYLLCEDAAIAGAFAVRYLPSFDDRNAQSRELSTDDIAATAVFFNQYDPTPFPYLDNLPKDCVTISFPSVDLQLLWPLSSPNPYNDLPTQDRPWGRFPTGDRVIIECVERGCSLEETIDYYRTSSASHLPDLKRYAAMERGRLAARETKCDVAMSDFVFERFVSENIFWTENHPTMGPLRELARRLLDAARARRSDIPIVDLDATIERLPADGPLSFLRIPIHPEIVSFFNLAWYRDRAQADFGLRFESPLDAESYFREMAILAVQMHEEQKQLIR